MFGILVETVGAFIKPSLAYPWDILFKEAIGEILVGFGVAGEILFSRRASIRQEELGRRKDLEIGRLSEIIERERSKRVDLELRLKHADSRILDKQELDLLKEEVKSYHGQEFSIEHIPSGSPLGEPEFFAAQIYQVLIGAGWVFRDGFKMGSSQPIASGVMLYCGPQPSTQGAAGALFGVLQDCHIKLRYPMVRLAFKDPVVVVEIGLL